MSWDPSSATSAMRSIEAAYLIGVEGATEVWLIRHGDCYEGLAESTDGDIRTRDPSLSPIGLEQARRLARRMRGIQLDALYSSPLRRAQETADFLGSEVKLEPRLAEVEVDTSSGRVEVIEQPDLIVARMSAAIEEAVAANRGGRVVMVGHGVAILMYVCDVLRLEFGRLRILPYYTSVSVVRLMDQTRRIGSLGDTTHLSD